MCEKDPALSPRAPLSREAVKAAAMLAMLANHVAEIFMERGAFWTEVLTDIGYFTAPVMCWFLVEGYGRTRSKKRYALRLAAFAALSELPFCLAFSRDGLEFVGMNMLYTLLVCFGILLAGERLRPGLPRRLAQTALTLLTVLPPSDWGLLAPAYTLLFDWAKGSRRRTMRAFGWAAGLFFLANLPAGGGRMPPGRSLLCALGAAAGVALAGAAILWLYSGRRSARGQRFTQWAFYIFYPAHLLALGLARVAFST